MIKRLFLIALVALLAMGSVIGAYAAEGDLYDDGEIVIDATNLYPKTDGGSTLGKTGNEFAGIYVDSLNTAGDLTFKASLIAAGRVNAASTVQSSSTNLAPASLPYVILRKYVGGNNGLDETDGGTHLPNGISGQILKLIIMEVDTDGSWIVTPVTSLTLATLTFDAADDMATLLYVDDTIGWLLLSSTSVTIVYNDQVGIHDGVGMRP